MVDLPGKFDIIADDVTYTVQDENKNTLVFKWDSNFDILKANWAPFAGVQAPKLPQGMAWTPVAGKPGHYRPDWIDEEDRRNHFLNFILGIPPTS